MGNKTAVNISTLQVCQPSPPGEWQKEGTTGYCDLVRNRKTGQLAEQYVFPRDQRLSIEEDCRRYQFRRQQRSGLVEVYQVERGNPQQHMCRGDELIKVRTQRIVRRLADRDNDVSREETLLVLQQSLQGFSVIAAKYGPVWINDEMIGWTPDGRVKVWLNEDLWRNAPDENSEIFASRRRSNQFNPTQSMLEQLLDSLEGHMRPPRLPEEFKQGYIKAAASGNFETVSAYITNYAKGFSPAASTLRPIQHSVKVVPQASSTEQLIALGQSTPQATSIALALGQSQSKWLSASPSHKTSFEVPLAYSVQHVQSSPMLISKQPTITGSIRDMLPTQVSPRKVHDTSIRTNNFFNQANLSPNFTVPNYKNLSVGHSKGNINQTSRNISLGNTTSRMVVNSNALQAHLPITALPTPSQKQAMTPRTHVDFKTIPQDAHRVNNASYLRFNPAFEKTSIPAAVVPNPAVNGNSLSRQFIVTPNLNKSMHIPPASNTSSMLAFNGASQSINRLPVNSSLPTNNMASALRFQVGAEYKKRLASQPQPGVRVAMSKPSNFAVFRKPSPQVIPAQTLNSLFPRNSEGDGVTPETLFEDRPPTAERNQIKIVYEDQQLDAYTLENLAKLNLTTGNAPYHQLPTQHVDQQPTTTAQHTPRQSVEQPIRYAEPLQQPPKVVEQPAQEISHTFATKVTAESRTIQPEQAHVIDLSIQDAESRPIVLKHSLPKITFSFGDSIKVQATTQQKTSIAVKPVQQVNQPTLATKTHAITSEQTNVRVLQSIKVEEPYKAQAAQQPINATYEFKSYDNKQREAIEQKPQQPASATPSNGVRYEQVSSEYQQQYLSELQEYQRRQVQAAQEDQLRREREAAQIQAIQKARIDAEQARIAKAEAEARALELAAQQQQQARIAATINSPVSSLITAPEILGQTKEPFRLENITETLRSQESPPKRISNLPTFIPAQSSPNRVIVQPTIYERLSEEGSLCSSQQIPSVDPSPRPSHVTKEVELIEHRGRPIGYEVVETDVYYTPEGDRITIEEDIQVVYDEHGRQRIIDTDEQFPVSESNIPSGIAADTRATQQLNITIPQAGTRITESPTAVRYNILSEENAPPPQPVYDDLEAASPIIRLVGTQSVESRNGGGFSLNPTVIPDQQSSNVEYASSLKYSSGIQSSGGASSDRFFSGLRGEADIGDYIPEQGVPTYEGLRAEILEDYGTYQQRHPHRNNPLFTARIESLETYETSSNDDGKDYEPVIPMPPQATYSLRP